MTKMSSVQNIRLTWRLIKPPPAGAAACSPSWATATPVLAMNNAIDDRSVRMWFPMIKEGDEAPWSRDRGASSRSGGVRELERDQQADDDGKQRRAFDERRQDQRARLDGSGDLGLASHALGCAGADTPNAESSANGREAGADTRALHGPRARIVLRVRGRGLQERK